MEFLFFLSFFNLTLKPSGFAIAVLMQLRDAVKCYGARSGVGYILIFNSFLHRMALFIF